MSGTNILGLTSAGDAASQCTTPAEAPASTHHRIDHPQSSPPTQPLDSSGELPSLNETFLDWDALDCVLADLDDFTTIIETMGRNVSEAPFPIVDIVDARDRLVRGDIHGLQITYLFADQTWVDTFIRESEGARLLRILHQSNP